MRHFLVRFLVLLALILPAIAQTAKDVPDLVPRYEGRFVDFEAAMPTSITTVYTGDILVETITITNTTAADLTFTITNVGGTAFAKDTIVAANSFYVISIPTRRRFTGGMRWSASGAGLNGYFLGRVQQ